MSSPHDAPSNPYVFVVGCPRSGTTLLQRMLDNHPQLAVANDSHFIPRVIKDRPAGIVNPPLTPTLVEYARTYHRFYRLGLDAREVEWAAHGAPTYRAFVGRLYDAYAGKRGKPFAGEKTPDYCRHIPLLHALFPRARFIHIIRDGRDVALSTMEWANEDKGPGKLELWRTDPLATCALWWRRQVSIGCHDGRPLGPETYTEVRYEALVQDPEPELRRLSGFLDLEYSPEMAHFFEGRTKRKPGLSAKKAWLPATPGLRDWRDQMDASDETVFELLTDDLLRDLNLPMNAPRLRHTHRLRADRARIIWESHHRPRPLTIPHTEPNVA